MSRAVVNKGNQVSVNRHSDYEFFLSRRRSGLPWISLFIIDGAVSCMYIFINNFDMFR